jgi:hypothetical protein
MKRFILGLFALGFSATGFSQNNAGGVIAVKKSPSPEVLERAFRNGTVDFQQTHTYKKQVMQQNFGSGSRGSRALAFDTLGTAGNAFTILDGAVNRVAANQATNSITFIHRANAEVDQNTNLAQYKYDISKDGGNTWTNDLGTLTPTLENFDTAGRFPQAVFYNPAGNTNPDNAYLVYYGTWLPFGGTGSGRTWDGVVTGVAKTDNSPASYTENIERPNNGDINVTKSLTNGLPGEFWAINFATAPGDSLDVIDLLVSHGVWNSTTNDVDWSHNRLNTPFVIESDGGAPIATASIAFDPTGTFGWIAFLGDISGDADSTLNPNFYRTTDGGANWTGPFEVKLSSLPNVVAGLTLDTVPNSGFDGDLVVDANGNPHYAFVVGAYAGQGYSIATAAQGGGSAGLKIYDITYNPNVSVECQWQAIFIDDIQTFRGVLSTAGGADFGEDNRPQVSRSEDGNIVFIGWADSDPALVSNNANDLPNFKGRMLNIQSGLGTAVVNFTETDPIWSGSALFPSVSPTFLTNGNTYTVPTVFLQFNTTSGNADDPTNFYHIKGISFTASDFNQALGADVPTITLLGDNPQYTYLGDVYNELGATADDCNDGALTPIIDATNVNTNARGTYTVSYNVTDSDNNTASAERQVIVNTEPDTKFGYTFGTGFTLQFRDSSLYDPTSWQWNFGDGGGNSTRNPVKTYTQAGTYTVCLRARNIYNSAPFNKPVDEECQTIVVTGIEEKVVSQAFNIFPNPGKGIFNIELKNQEVKNASIEVYNVLGEKITSSNLNLGKQTNFRLDMSSQPNGVYMVKFVTEKGNATKSITLIQ